MTDRIDHAAEARRAMNQTLNCSETDENTGALVSIAAAQVHATLALVEQARIANLLALAESGRATASGVRAALSGLYARRVEGGSANMTIRPDIAAALGIETGAGDE